MAARTLLPWGKFKGVSLAQLAATPEGHSYLFFLASIPFSFYSFGMIFLVFLSAVTNRDFGPMLRAENRARADICGHFDRVHR